MASGDLLELRKAYETAFTVPYASHEWRSERGRSHWVDLEGWQDWLAGPLSSVAETGGCGYVYPREDDYFAGIADPMALRTRLIEKHAGLAAGVERFSPTLPEENEDFTYMKSLVKQMRDLVEWACKVEHTQWLG